jgi:hypothetical protein
MGTTSAQINNQINSTRDQIDANLDVLEKRAASNMRRAAIIGGASAAAALVVGGIAFVAYRRMHKPTFRERVQHAMPDSWMDFQKDMRKRLGNRPFKVVISSADTDENGESVWESTARKVAPTLITSAASALMAQAMKRRNRSSEPASTRA